MIKSKRADEFNLGERFKTEAFHKVKDTSSTYEIIRIQEGEHTREFRVIDVSDGTELSRIYFNDDVLDVAPPL